MMIHGLEAFAAATEHKTVSVHALVPAFPDKRIKLAQHPKR
jgi:hypothetical protein